jgi:hypothetical protein
MGILYPDGGNEPLPPRMPERDMTARLKQATSDMQASLRRSKKIKVTIDKVAAATDKVLARIKERLPES